jgi:hypothetical protein
VSGTTDALLDGIMAAEDDVFTCGVCDQAMGGVYDVYVNENRFIHFHYCVQCSMPVCNQCVSALPKDGPLRKLCDPLRTKRPLCPFCAMKLPPVDKDTSPL